RGANVWRVKFIGEAGFTANITSGVAPLAVQFADQSNVPSPSAWHWDFGDNTSSAQQNPVHMYTRGGMYNVRLAVAGPAGGIAVVQKNAFIIVSELESRSLSTVFSLQQNYPNPFGSAATSPALGGRNPATAIAFSIPRESRVRVSIYDMLGREVIQLVSDLHHRAGEYSTSWNGADALGALVGSGVYFYRITATPFDGGAPYVDTKKMLLVR
ncbi:MAG: PKD domain-containing protein, partial [bacterium]